MSAAPSALRIRGRWWPVRYRPRQAMEGCLGMCQPDPPALGVATKQTPFDTRDTLLHEAIHAILISHQWDRTAEEEERYVLAISTGLTGLFQDNPQFALWLSEPVKT